jgi:hypothetical protein
VLVYAPALLAAMNGELDTDVASWTWTLHTSAYTPDRVTHDYVNDLTGELATGAGYTSGGVAMAATRTRTAANSWVTSRANSTAYTLGTVVRPATGNGFLYRAVVAGSSGASIPTFPTVVGTTVVDGTVTWLNVGTAITVINTAAPVWNSATFTGVRYAVLSYRAAGTAATQPLVAYADFVTDRAGQSGSFTVNPPPQGIVHLFTS